MEKLFLSEHMEWITIHSQSHNGLLAIFLFESRHTRWPVFDEVQDNSREEEQMPHLANLVTNRPCYPMISGARGNTKKVFTLITGKPKGRNLNNQVILIILILCTWVGRHSCGKHPMQRWRLVGPVNYCHRTPIGRSDCSVWKMGKHYFDFSAP